MQEDSVILHTYRLRSGATRPAGIPSPGLMQITDHEGTISYVFPPNGEGLDIPGADFGLYRGVAVDLPLPRGLRRVRSLLPENPEYWDGEPEMVTATDDNEGSLTVKLVTLLEKVADQPAPSADKSLAGESAAAQAVKISTDSTVITAFACTGAGYPCIVLCMTRGGTKDYPSFEWDHSKHYPGVMADFAARTGNAEISEAPVYLLPGIVREEGDVFGLRFKVVYVALTTHQQRIQAHNAIMEHENDFHLSKWQELNEINDIGIMVDPVFELRPCDH